MDLNDHEIGYIAGILDGEGSITIGYERKRNFLVPQMFVVSVDKNLIEWLHSRLGGFCISNQPSKTSRQVYWKWYLKSPNLILEILSKVNGHLIIKKERSELMLRYLKTREIRKPISGKKQAIPSSNLEMWNQMRVLNERGGKAHGHRKNNE